jgi:hypothetical protein
MSKETRRERYNANLKVRKEKARNFTKCELQDLCEEKGYTMQHMTEYHIRVEGKLDIYPTSRKYHLITKNERGEIHDLEKDIIRLLNK